MDSLVSIIIPIYNSEKYISRCLDCVCRQTYRHWEAILLDDGSSDDSAIVCKKYSAKDSRFRYIYQENQGVSLARKLALKEAKGKYVVFLDSDDLLRDDAISCFVEIAERENADIVVSDYYNFTDITDLSNIENNDKISYRFVDKYEAWRHLFDEKHMVYGALWGAIYRAKVFDNINFPSGRTYEDTSVAHMLYQNSQKTYYIDNKLYFYFYNDIGITKQMTNKNIIDSLVASEERTLWFREHLGKKSDIHYMSMCIHIRHTMSCYTKISDNNTKKRALKSFDLIVKYFQILKNDVQFGKECICFRIKQFLSNGV